MHDCGIIGVPSTNSYFRFQTGRRRSSHLGVRPKFKTHRPKRAPAPQPDADGWVTLDKHKNHLVVRKFLKSKNLLNL